MAMPIREDYEIGVLTDLPDERRHKKPWLPEDGNDVSHDLVSLREWSGKLYPACYKHGAMLCVAQEGHIWRCGEEYCGVGAIYRKMPSP